MRPRQRDRARERRRDAPERVQLEAGGHALLVARKLLGPFRGFFDAIAQDPAHRHRGDRPLLLKEEPRERFRDDRKGFGKERRFDDRRGPRDRDGRGKFDKGDRRGPRELREFKPRPTRPPEEGMKRFRVEVGAVHGVKPGQLVGAIAGEGGITGKQIGRIEIHKTHSTVDLPADMDPKALSKLQKTRVCRRPIRIAAVRDDD